MKKMCLPLVMLVLCGAVWAQGDGFIAVRVNVPGGLPGQMLPVVASMDAADLQRAWGKAPQRGLVQAVERLGNQDRGVLAQLDLLEGGRAQVALLLVSEPSGERTIRLLPGGMFTGPGPQPLEVKREGTATTVSSEFYQITHDSAVNGGLPSKIVFPQTGKVFDSFTLNDRLHSKQESMGGFRFGDDKAAEVKVVAAGPFYAEVRVSNRFMQGNRAAPGGARGVYTYRYVAGLPVVRVGGEIAQDEAFNWNELHFFELHFKNESFTRYATDVSGGLQPFADDSTSKLGSQWGLLADGKSVIGMLGSARLYDGNKDYGRYLHGPWVPWATTGASFALDIWMGAADDPAATIAQAAANKLGVLAGVAYSPKLLADVSTIQQRSRTAPALGWRLSLLQTAMREQGLSLAEAEKAAAALLQPTALRSNALQLGQEALYLVAGKRLGVGLNRAHDRLVSVFDLLHGRELLAAPALWFRLQLGNAEGVTRTLDSTDFFLRQPGAVATGESWGPKQPNQQFKLQFFSKGTEFPGLTVTLKPTLLDDRLQWSVAVDNARGDWSLLQVTCPVLQVASLGNDAGDDRLLVPNGFGRAYPVNSRPGYTGNYPSGGGCMQWMAVTDDTSGLYLGVHDPTASTKLLMAPAISAAPGVPLSVGVPAPDATVPGNDFTMPGEFVIAAVDGGYFPACDLYRTWLDKNAPWWPEPGKFSRSDYPQWIQDVQTWVLWGAGDASKTVEPVKTFAEAMGVPTALHWYNWHQIPFDNDYPHYFPTKPGFREGVAELQQAGVRVMPYINGRLWDTDTESFKAEAHQYATKREDGSPYIETYGSKQELAPMCIHTQYWKDTLQEIVRKLVAEENVDAVYLDQIGAARAVLCYDKSHGHPLAGGGWWVEGYWKLLDEMQKRIASVHPDKALTTESNAEPYAKYFDGYLMCNSNSDYEAPLFPAVYGGKILMFGTYTGSRDLEDMSLMALRQGKLFAFGSQLWWSYPTVSTNEQATKWLRDLAHLRQSVNEFFVHGKMAAPPVFAEQIATITTDFPRGQRLTQIHTPDLWATTWRTEDGALLMPLANILPQERTMTLQFDPAAYGLKAGRAVKVEHLRPGAPKETVGRPIGKASLPLTLRPSEVSALLITPQ